MARPVSFPSPDAGNVEVFTLGDWQDLEVLGRPSANWTRRAVHQDGREGADNERACVMFNINGAIGMAIWNASAVEKIPESRDQERYLDAVRRQAVALLDLLGYDELGTIQAPNHAGRRITALMPWFQYLESAFCRVPMPGAEWLFDALGGHYFLGTRGPLAGGEATHGWWAEQSGWEPPLTAETITESDPLLFETHKSRTFENVLRSVPSVLAFLAALATAARDNPITNQRKANFERAFAESLFFGLAQRYPDMFGKSPRSWRRGAAPGVSDGKRPGPAALWAKRIVSLAAERLPALVPKEGSLDLGSATGQQTLAALRAMAAREDDFFAERMTRGWKENAEMFKSRNWKHAALAD